MQTGIPAVKTRELRIRSIAKSTQKDPIERHFTLVLERARLQQSQGRLDEARKTLRRARQRFKPSHTNNPVVWFLQNRVLSELAYIELSQGNRKAAEKMMHEISDSSQRTAIAVAISHWQIEQFRATGKYKGETLDHLGELNEGLAYSSNPLLRARALLAVANFRLSHGQMPTGFEALRKAEESVAHVSTPSQREELSLEVADVSLSHGDITAGRDALRRVEELLEKKNPFRGFGITLEQLTHSITAFNELDLSGLAVGTQSYVKLLLLEAVKEERLTDEFVASVKDEVIPALRVLEEVTKAYPTMGMELQLGIDERAWGEKRARLEVDLMNYLSDVHIEHGMGRSELTAEKKCISFALHQQVILYFF